jgi:hypothetical protein
VGHVAKRYYAAGRKLDAQALNETFASMLTSGKSLQARYAGEIEQRANTIDVRQIASLVQQQ